MQEKSPSPCLSAQDLKKDTTESEEGTLPPKNGQKIPTPKEKSTDLFKKHACPTCHYQTNDLSNYNRHYAKHAKSIIPGFRCLAKGCTKVAQQASNLFRGHLEHEVSIRNAAHVTFLNDNRIAIEDGDSQERRALHSQMKCLIIRDKESKSWVMYNPRTDFRSGDGDESFDSLPEATANQALPPERKSLPAHEESSVLPINDEKDECGTSDKLPDLKGDQEKEETLGMRDDCLKDLPLKKRTDAFVQSRTKKRRTGEAV